jgi:hypothetical protein
MLEVVASKTLNGCLPQAFIKVICSLYLNIIKRSLAPFDLIVAT